MVERVFQHPAVPVCGTELGLGEPLVSSLLGRGAALLVE